MKNYKLTIIAAISILFVTAASAWANPAPQPAACPHASVIKSLGLTKIHQDSGSQRYSVIQTNSYNTKDTWDFMVNAITASSETEAKSNALAALSSLEDSANPTPRPFFDKWLCVYTINQYEAFAITPAIF